MAKIEGLAGDYCDDCIRGLTYFKLALYAIIPMCRPDLHQFVTNGDAERVSKLIDEKESQCLA